MNEIQPQAVRRNASRTARYTLAPLALTAALLAAGCSSLNPVPLKDKEAADRAAADRLSMYDSQEPIGAPVTLEQAIARALKYNLDLRLKMMERATYGQLHEVSKYDMLPSVIVGAGYADRSNFSGGESRVLFGPAGSRPRDAGPANGAFSTSQERQRTLASAEFSWNVLDFGVSYYRAKQRADEFLIAEERRRRVAQTIVHDVRSAYWRALAAQRLASDTDALIKRAEQAIAKSREAETRGVVPVNTALAYQRALTDAVALLNLRRQELDFAKAELAALMSAPAGSFVLADQAEPAMQAAPANLAILEDTALQSRPELREEDYRRRISADETRRQLMQAFPNLALNIGAQYDSNDLAYNKNWIDTGLRASWSLIRLIAAPAVKDAGKRQIDQDDARRQALSMAILTQTRIAALRYGLALSDLQLAQSSLQVDERIAKVARDGVSSKVETELELVRAEARALVSRYQRSIAYAGAQAAYARIQHSLGKDIDVGPTDTQSVAQLAERLGPALKAADGALPVAAVAAAGPRPKVFVEVSSPLAATAMMGGVVQALDRSGFEVVRSSQGAAMSLLVSLKLDAADKGLRRGEVVLSQQAAPQGGSARKSTYTAVLPGEPRDATMTAMGEAAVMSSVGYLREWLAPAKP
jgi:outer membrane protein TolC